MNTDTFWQLLVGGVLANIGLALIAFAFSRRSRDPQPQNQTRAPHLVSPSIVLIGVLLVLAAWYWYSFRPSHIRAECARKSPPTAPAVLRKIAPEAYDACLAKHGLAQ